MSKPIDALEFVHLVDGFYLEALLIDGEEVWFTDVACGGVRRLGSEQIVLSNRPMIGGLLLDESGALLVSGANGIVWVDPGTGRTGVLVDGMPGVNEMRSDGRGGLYFGTIDLPGIIAGRTPQPSAIWHLSCDRVLRQLWDGLAFANGLAVSADGNELYFNESFRETKVFPITVDGSLGRPRSLAGMADCDRCGGQYLGLRVFVERASLPFARGK